MKKNAGSIAGILLLTCLLVGWSPFPDQLHREEGGTFEKAGIVNDYIEWKITREEKKATDGRRYVIVVWKANFRNTSDQKKRLWLTFQLLDKDGLLVGENSRGDNVFNAIYLLPRSEKVIEGEFMIDKARATSANKSAIRLGTEEVTETANQDKTQWRQLRKGMTEDQVRDLLGEPDRVTAPLSWSLEWYYANGGKVQFDTGDVAGHGTHRVDGWDEPRW